MTDWIYGEDVLNRTNKQMLREAGFPDADTCPMPFEHKDRERVDTWTVDNRTVHASSNTEWIAGKTWGEL